jgi:hypothetical protein
VAKKIKVRMVVSIAGNAEPLYDLEAFSFQPEQIVELHAGLARAWIASGNAKPVDFSEPEPETTSIAPPETAVLPEAKPRRGSKA